MPTYDYVCDNCGNKFDRFVSISKKDEQQCEECGTVGRQVILTPPAVDWDALAMGASASPEAIRHWEKKRAHQQAKEEKSKREHGDVGPAPGSLNPLG